MGEDPPKDKEEVAPAGKETLIDKIAKVVSSLNLVKINIKMEKVSLGGREINTEKYTEQNGDISFTTRPELAQAKEVPVKEIDNELFDNSDGFVNADLLQEETITTKQFFSKGDIIRMYNHILPEKDLSAVLDAYRVCFKEDNNQKDAIQAKDNLVRIYKDRGRTIYNFVRSKLFETEIRQKLEDLKKDKKDPLLVVVGFSEYFNSLIEFHPTNIYVAAGWAEDDILSEVSKRYQIIKEGKSGEIHIYSRSSNINTVNKLKEVESIKQTFNCKDDDYYFGKEPAKTTILTLK